MDKSSGMDETEYLLSSENNKEVLMRSISEVKGYKVTKEDISSIEPIIDSDLVVKMMDNMSISELKVLKDTCDLLIGCKESEQLLEQF